MPRIPIWLLTVSIFLSAFFPLVPGSASEPNPKVDAGGRNIYRLELVWEIQRGDDPPYALLDLEKESVPRDLFGLRVDDESNLYLVDNLTRKLIKIDRAGDVVFEVGQLGEGPEDVRTLGEPIFWPGFHIAQSDYSYRSKIVGYNARGEYAGSVDLAGGELISRIWDAAGNMVAVTSNLTRNQEGGFDVAVKLVAFGADGTRMKELTVVDKKIPPPDPNRTPNERDFELLPLVNCGSDGRIYVVPDPYRYRIECYDSDLGLLWTVENEVERIPLVAADREWKAALLPGRIEPASVYHAIDKLIPRADGTLWVLKGGPRSQRSKRVLEFETWGPTGKPEDPITLTGFPGLLGDFAVFDDRLIWKLNDDVEVNDGSTIYIGVFSLVR